VLLHNNILEKVLTYLNKINTTETIFNNILYFSANLVGTDLSIRDKLLEHELFEVLIYKGRTYSKNLSIQCRLVWLLSNVLRGKPYPNFNIGKVIVEEVSRIYKQFPHSELDTAQDVNDKESLNLEATWSVSQFLDAPDLKAERLDAILKCQVLYKCLSNLDSSTISLCRASLRILGVVTSQENHVAEEFIDLDTMHVPQC
jgi:hypothetical protein